MAKENKKMIALVGGARPNFMKIAPLYHHLKQERVKFSLLNAGQHFDAQMAGQFFDEFKIKADVSLSPRRDTPLIQFSDMMVGVEKFFLEEKPDIVLVFGDVNSTLAASLVANKCGIKLAHVEAGLRSFNRAMPEEINRILVDHLADLLFVTEESGLSNLFHEGIPKEKTFFVGNIMIDSLCLVLPSIKESSEKFYFCTLHRAENVDHKSVFVKILDALEVIAKDAKIYFPLHPRTEFRAKEFGLMDRLSRILTLLPPLSYQQTIFYEKNARLVLTDSGGIQEEASYLGVPCLTLRTETERPITVTQGTNTIAGTTKDSILAAYKEKKLEKVITTIPGWDGKTSGRIVQTIKERL